MSWEDVYNAYNISHEDTNWTNTNDNFFDLEENQNVVFFSDETGYMVVSSKGDTLSKREYNRLLSDRLDEYLSAFDVGRGFSIKNLKVRKQTWNKFENITFNYKHKGRVTQRRFRDKKTGRFTSKNT
jgi:hypothetical protein